MSKTLRVRTRAGWTTKPEADLDANRLTAAEVDDNFLAIEDLVNDLPTIAATPPDPPTRLWFNSGLSSPGLYIYHDGAYVQIGSAT